MSKRITLIIIYLISVLLFLIAYIPENFLFLLQLIEGIFFLLAILFDSIYLKVEKIKANFKLPVLFMVLSSLFAIIIAKIEHNQAPVITFWAQRTMLLYLLYFFLHILKPDIDTVKKAILTIGGIFLFCYLLQYFVYPTKVFAVRIDPERGTVRIFLPGFFFLISIFFIKVFDFYKSNSFKDVLFLVIALIVILLTGTRTVIASTGLLLIISLITTKKVKSRGLIYLLLFLSAIPIFFLFQNLILGLFEMSQKQGENFSEDIRVKSATYFLTEFFPSKLAYVFGNGEAHLASSYGMQVHMLKVYYGFYQSDIGIFGEYSKFGILYLLGVIGILYRGLTSRVSTNIVFIRFVLLSVLLQITFSLPFTEGGSIVLFASFLYLIDLDKAQADFNIN